MTHVSVMRDFFVSDQRTNKPILGVGFTEGNPGFLLGNLEQLRKINLELPFQLKPDVHFSRFPLLSFLQRYTKLDYREIHISDYEENPMKAFPRRNCYRSPLVIFGVRGNIRSSLDVVLIRMI